MLGGRHRLLCFDKPTEGFMWPSRVSWLKDGFSGQVYPGQQCWGWTGLCHPRILPSHATVFCKVAQPHTLSIMFPSQVVFFFFFPLGVPVFKKKKRNQNVLSIHECDRHLGLAPLMSYLCDLHKSPKGRKTRPVFHTEGCLNVVRGTLKDLKHFMTWKDFYWWNLMHFVGVEEIFLSRRKARLAHALKGWYFLM